MKHDLRLLQSHDRSELRIANVDLVEAACRRQVVTLTCGQDVHYRDFVAVFDQQVGNVGADEPGSTCNQHLHVLAPPDAETLQTASSLERSP